jgi:predicted DsbA family dithiol-disulfide isomerase
MTVAIDIELFTDPACPFAFSAEPIRQRLRWHYGDGLRWRTTMIVLTLEPGEAEKLQAGAPGLQRKYGMPIDPAPYSEPSSSEPACRAVVAARLNAPEVEQRLLRRLRIRRMDGGLLDDPELIAAAAADVGLDPEQLSRWVDSPGVEDALQADIARARNPSLAARALDHKLGGPVQQRRYTAPSYEFNFGGRTFAVPGFNPVEAYEAVIANLDPTLARRPVPENVAELLRWFDEPLATAEVEAIMGRPSRTQLGRAATPIPAGADCYWIL